MALRASRVRKRVAPLGEMAGKSCLKRKKPCRTVPPVLLPRSRMSLILPADLARRRNSYVVRWNSFCSVSSSPLTKLGMLRMAILSQDEQLR